FDWTTDNEDVHLNIERRLVQIVGDPGKKLHTGRSRNDQVATDLRLYLRDVIGVCIKKIQNLQLALVHLAEKHASTVMPGFTHLQVAQPVSFGHHLMAYYEMLKRDRERLVDCHKRVNTMPLGSAALAGTSYPIDRKKVSVDLKFNRISANSIDAVSDRDFAIEFCSVVSIIMMHLSRFSEEIILWMNPNFDFLTLPDSLCTGSSIMPQKKNPDVPELVRGKTGRANGNLIALLTIMKGQPLAYNKDNQEDKEPLFDTAKTVLTSLIIFTDLVNGIEVKPDKMKAALEKGHVTATDLADYLVKKGVSFRDAHGIVSDAVKYSEDKGVDLATLPLEKLQDFCSLISEDVESLLSIEGSINSRNHTGGTSPFQVSSAIDIAKKELKEFALKLANEKF
ncbi:MAG: argininosuccinate lyase, partial [Proteobacteria bacterium]|nr:argininosuccinate lyase [Pseudomonadota bacterium]